MKGNVKCGVWTGLCLEVDGECPKTNETILDGIGGGWGLFVQYSGLGFSLGIIPIL